MYLIFFIIAVALWGTDAAITKRFLLNSLPPEPMITMRLAVAAITLLPFTIQGWAGVKVLSRRDWLRMTLVVLVGTVAMNVLYYKGLVLVPSFITIILFRMEPVFTILILSLFLGQPASLRTWLLTLAAIISAALVTLGQGVEFSLEEISMFGVGLVMLASICSSISTIVAKRLLDIMSPLLLTGLRTGLASFCLLAWQGPTIVKDILPVIPRNDLLLIIGLGVVFSGFGFWMYYKGLQGATPLVGSLVGLLRIVSGLIASYALLNEIPTLVQWVGVVGLMGALYLLAAPQKPPAASAL